MNKICGAFNNDKKNNKRGKEMREEINLSTEREAREGLAEKATLFKRPEGSKEANVNI